MDPRLGLLSEKERLHLQQVFGKSLTNEVRIVMFTQEFECEFCKDTKEIVFELAQTSPKLRAEVYDFVKDKEKVKEYEVDKIPAIVLVGKKNYGIRFYGAPSGYEFAALIEDIVDVSNGKTNLSTPTKEKLKKITKRIHIQVFSTPTCPYCRQAVRLGHQFAIENQLIRADMVEIIEFPFLAERYSVMGVPKIVINETVSFVGALPEDKYVEYVLTAHGKGGARMFV